MFERRYFGEQFIVAMSEMRRSRLPKREPKPLPPVSDETRAFQEECAKIRARIEGLTQGEWK